VAARGDNKAVAERLMQIERRLAALEGLARDVRVVIGLPTISSTVQPKALVAVAPGHCHERAAGQVRCSAANLNA
jgi:hypothetical protein